MTTPAKSRYADAVGRTSPPVTWEVERGHVRRFIQAVGDPHDYGELVPPTFAIALRANDAREGLDIDWTKLLHAEQEFSYRRPLKIGDRITLVGKITEAYVKAGKSGPMDFMVLENTATDAAGEVVYTTRSTIVIKR
jgi:hypothetical protein